MEFRTPPSVSALSASVPTLAFFGSTTGRKTRISWPLRKHFTARDTTGESSLRISPSPRKQITTISDGHRIGCLQTWPPVDVGWFERKREFRLHLRIPAWAQPPANKCESSPSRAPLLLSGDDGSVATACSCGFPYRRGSRAGIRTQSLSTEARSSFRSTCAESGANFVRRE
jgi:hypothetical protein